MFPDMSFGIRVIPDEVPVSFLVEDYDEMMRRLASVTGYATVEDYERSGDRWRRSGTITVEMIWV